MMQVFTIAVIFQIKLQFHFIESGISNDSSEPIDSVLLRFASDPIINRDANFNGQGLFSERFIGKVRDGLKHLLDESGIVSGVVVSHG